MYSNHMRSLLVSAIFVSACQLSDHPNQPSQLKLETSSPVVASDGVVCRSDIVRNSLLKDRKNRILIAAHRGAHMEAPENSLRAIRDAVSAGADIVELDVRVSSDGVPVIMHDRSVNRTTNGNGLVSELSLDDLKRLRLKGGDGALTEELVPTLEEALKTGKDRILINLDMKASDVEAVMPVVKTSGNAALMFYSDDLETLSNIRKVKSDAIVMPLAKKRKEAILYVKAFELEIVHLREDYASLHLSRELDELTSAGWLNALGEIDKRLLDGSITAADKIISFAPDVIQTDQPGLLRNILRERGLSLETSNLTFDAPCMVSVN